MSDVKSAFVSPPQPPGDLELRETFAGLGVVTESERMLPVLRQAWKAAHAADATILIEGETGTGKQVFAEAIHRLDRKRRSFSFITVHCATIQENLAESELFGHQKGSFSGATSDRRGLFRAAQQGTLFLDDVNDLPAPIQAKLLDVLQRGVVRPVGSDREIPVDVRVIAASNQPLEQLVQEKAFRIDLYYRLHAVHLKLPPLRERMEDLPALMIALARRNESAFAIDQVDPQLAEHLKNERFEGNIRQLEHAVRRMLLDKASGTSFDLADWLAQHIPEAGSVAAGDPWERVAELLWPAIRSGRTTFSSAFATLERKLLESALHETDKTRRDVAADLGISERTLYQKLRQHGLANGRCPDSAKKCRRTA